MSRHLPPILPYVFLLLLIPSRTSTDWTSECVSRYPASCRCTWSSGKRLADCQKSNMNGLPILSNDIQILDMSHNKLTSIQDNAFTIANLINLQKLYLKGCRITKIGELAFNNLRILIEVDLSHNEIEFIDPIVFTTNVRLRIVKLNNNRLHRIAEFPVLDYLTSVDLSYNNLANFTYHTFNSLRNLKVLDLSHNAFTNLDPSIFPRLSSLMLRGNAWVCDCELKPLRDYILGNKLYEPELRCSEPLSLFNSQWDAFDELSCKPEILHILANGKVVDSIVALENTLVLSCVVRGEPLPEVKWVKNGRVVQEASMSVLETERIVMLNLTVGRNDNEFVCVGSNSGGVVERNLTVTVDEAGLQGFVVLKVSWHGSGQEF